MVKVLFDTNILIDFLNGREPARVELQRFSDRAISVITWMEVMVGASPDMMDATRAFLQSFEQIPLHENIAAKAVLICRERRIKLPDAIVWASALVNDRLLVTRNIKDFPADEPGVRMPYQL